MVEIDPNLNIVIDFMIILATIYFTQQRTASEARFLIYGNRKDSETKDQY